LNPKEVQKQIKSGQLVIKQKWSLFKSNNQIHCRIRYYWIKNIMNRKSNF
jgi:hypothetical protein